ncbi:hypothetical protein CTEN210_14119 [Chaetoceros tenuissimus]|uniref:G-protein coupled receptors family 1 profile domain-containing protein n=1 Tax=Chaetoceros tenuissimus TaxID=426638 RepID=A0AAD3D4I7_9STRA|nr:hypothetical protein CTEN210_14119 [Chaetoceros tenuissimus]
MTLVTGAQHTVQTSRSLLGHELSTRNLTDGISENYFAFTRTGLILPIVAGTLSFVSSSAIIVTIFRSKQNTQYHRIMLVMSIFDAISSLFIALTTLPMPSEVNEGGWYHFQGVALGSTVTCELQAFLIFLGLGMCCICNMFLNIYFFASIRYDVNEKKFRIFAEPTFLLFTSFAWVIPIHFLRVGMLNPSPFEPFCFYSTYPYDCQMPGGPDCIRGDKDPRLTHKFYLLYFLIFISSLITVLVMTMIGILWTVFFEKVETDEASCDIREGGRTNNETIQDSQNKPCTRTSQGLEEHQTQIVGGESIQKVSKYSQKEKKAMAIQALMYILTCLLVWGSSVLSFFQTMGFGAIYVFFMPLQGFFNFLIFSGVKVYVATAVTKECSSIAHALRTLFFSPHLLNDRSIIGNMDLVREHGTRENNEVEISINLSQLFHNGNINVEDGDSVENEVIYSRVVEDPFHCNIAGGEDLLSAGSPTSVFPASSRNGEDFSYMSKSRDKSTSIGAVSSSASTVKR